MAADRYSLTQRLLHWLIALMVIGLLAVGLTLGTLGFEGTRDRFGIDVTNALYKYHKTFGVLVLALMLLRFALRQMRPPPPYDPDLPEVFRTLGRLNHLALYALLIVQPMIGWAATAAGDFPIEFFEWKLPRILAKDKPLSDSLYSVHGAIGWTILALVLIHVSAASFHWLVRRDGVMRRMGFG